MTLENKWKEYRIDLGSEDLGNVICGFGYALSESAAQGTDAKASAVVFYLDEICFENVQRKFTGKFQIKKLSRIHKMIPGEKCFYS